MCSFCDPTSDSPDPVAKRFEMELEAANLRIRQLETECGHLQADLYEAGDGDTWREACKRVEGELEATRTDNTRLRGLLREVKNGYGLTASWWNRVTAALEGRQ